MCPFSYPPIYVQVSQMVSSLHIFELKCCMYLSSLPCRLQDPFISSSFWFYYSNHIWWGVQIMKYLTNFSTFVLLPLFLSTKYLPQQAITNHHQSVTSKVSNAYKTTILIWMTLFPRFNLLLASDDVLFFGFCAIQWCRSPTEDINQSTIAMKIKKFTHSFFVNVIMIPDCHS